LAHQNLKVGTKDIDVIVESRSQQEVLAKGLRANEYEFLPIGTLAVEYQALGALTYENPDGFRWEIFRKNVANNLSLSTAMKVRSKAIKKGDKLSVYASNCKTNIG
jgi:hypothetical protein